MKIPSFGIGSHMNIDQLLVDWKHARIQRGGGGGGAGVPDPPGKSQKYRVF